ncbi:lactoylglutathione lyase [Hydrogenispora ethanolica]|uniref:Lactoylglutathione lyase n=1 Tax=Hydrogenispora ethanolica TaxID=1082276 RepID=A0A4R1RA35_HYDET|nr:VOC family protein [Hydrogenispora ethanolica]TCL62601.1 lactoylglutathione lyase [Hydrogenispora ethanolica]
MKFCWSTLRVKDLEESIKFYTDIVGLEVVNKFSAGPGVEIAFLDSGETKIELICDGENRDSNVGNDISWGFEVGSLDKALALVKEKGIPVDSGPLQPNPHVKFFFIKDPNGMKIQLVENMA